MVLGNSEPDFESLLESRLSFLLSLFIEPHSICLLMILSLLDVDSHVLLSATVDSL